ncbi:MAG TPA: hypothetical protein VHK90_14280, partial [Thermoanaerobaculia bacterium]|nr:hypothetical protein [Thermoanaerobaculia bacterium]
DDGQSFDLLLEEVQVVLEKHVSPRLRRDSFSLFFVGPPNAYLRQSTYQVAHDVLGGPWLLFLVPVGRRNDTFLYEAAFTRSGFHSINR